MLLHYCRCFPGQEIIVVCNGCRDRTLNIVKRLCSEYSQLKLLAFEENLGKGGAIIEGFKVASGDRVGFVDADESVEPEDIKKISIALSNVDGIIASRKLQDSVILVKQPLQRRIASKIFNVLIRIIFSLDFKDTQCGAKIFKKEAINSVLYELNAKGFEFDVELLWKLKNKGYRVIEFPIAWKHSEGSTFSLWKAPSMFFALLRVRLCKKQKRN